MCSTLQSPRAAKAFSSACAARTCPAPDDAESNSTRGLLFMPASPSRKHRPSRLGFPRGQLFQDASRHALDVPKARQIILKFLIHGLRFLWPELNAQNHIPQFNRVRQQRIFLQFLKRGLGVVVVHAFLVSAKRECESQSSASNARSEEHTSEL